MIVGSILISKACMVDLCLSQTRSVFLAFAKFSQM